MDTRHPRVDPLTVPEASLGDGSPISLVRVPTHEAVIAAFAQDLYAEYRAARSAGRTARRLAAMTSRDKK